MNNEVSVMWKKYNLDKKLYDVQKGKLRRRQQQGNPHSIPQTGKSGKIIKPKNKPIVVVVSAIPTF